jgi:hypothetical protein
VPAVPEKLRTLDGHAVAPEGIMQTSPTKGTMTETVTLWDSDPLVPVTCAVKLPDELLLTVRVAFPDVAMLVGLIVAVRPDDAVTVRETVPENPLIGLTTIVEVALVPLGVVRLDGMALMVKSGAGLLTVRDTLTVWDSVPLVPAT